MLHVEGSSSLRHVLACSLLSRRPVTITNIHPSASPTGIDPKHEANFLKFVQRATTGTKMEVQDQNTTLKFSPGLILGGTFDHDVPDSRCVSYCIEGALLILPFAKFDSRIRFAGATQSDIDLSVDTLRVVTCRIMQMFGVEVSLRVIRRGCAPNGNGCVELSITHLKAGLKSVKLTQRGKVRRIRGIAYSCRVAPDLPQRAATAAKGLLLQVLPDVYVVSDADMNANKNTGSGYGVVLVAETTSKLAVVSQETVARGREAAEEVGERAAALLFDQIAEGGCVDASHQMLTILLMGIGPADASTVRFGPLTPSAVTALSLLEQFFGVTSAIKNETSVVGTNEDGEEVLPGTTLITCVGCNIVNIARKSG